MFNLFQSVGDPTIICAFPDGGPAPGFLDGRNWTFHDLVDDIRTEQFECDRTFVDAIVETNGFYIYTRM